MFARGIRCLVLAAFVPACSDGDGFDADAFLEQKRVALGLRSDPLPVKEAMERLRRFERPLASAEATLEEALRIENLLGRVDAGGTDGDFREFLAASRTRARQFALARIDGPAADEGVALERSCVECHQKYQSVD